MINNSKLAKRLFLQRDFIKTYSFRLAGWNDIRKAFETVTGKNLESYFAQWVNRKDITHIYAENVELFEFGNHD